MTLTVKGFKDFSGREAEKRQRIKEILVNTFEKYGFEPAETPIIEYEKFAKKDSSDEVISDIFKLRDKGKRNLALRYEFTFQLDRLAKNKKIPYKRYQIGEVFRDEPVSANRFRQFTQCDIDVVGSTVKDEAEILAITSEILKQIGIKSVILVNNRKLMNEILESEGIKQKEEVLREIDKYDKIGEKETLKNLKKYGAEKILKILKQKEKFFKKFESYKEMLDLIKYCKIYGVGILFSPTIVRGLSYYNGNVFEVKTKGIKETIVGGGSYRANKIQATGISFGLERLSALAKLDADKEKYLVVSLDQDKEAIQLAQKLRKKGEVVSVYYGKPSKALEYANSYNFLKVIFVGKKEIQAGKFKIKDMASGRTTELKI